MDNTSPRTSVYLFAADSIRDEDERQDAYLAILEAKPQTYAEAQAIVSRVAHAKRNTARKRPMQLSVEPSTDASACLGMHDAISRLPDAERELVQLRYLRGMTVREIAAEQGRSVAVTHEALTLAVSKLRTILK